VRELADTRLFVLPNATENVVFGGLAIPFATASACVQGVVRAGGVAHAAALSGYDKQGGWVPFIDFFLAAVRHLASSLQSEHASTIFGNRDETRQGGKGGKWWTVLVLAVINAFRDVARLQQRMSRQQEGQVNLGLLGKAEELVQLVCFLQGSVPAMHNNAREVAETRDACLAMTSGLLQLVEALSRWVCDQVTEATAAQRPPQEVEAVKRSSDSLLRMMNHLHEYGTMSDAAQTTSAHSIMVPYLQTLSLLLRCFPSRMVSLRPLTRDALVGAVLTAVLNCDVTTIGRPGSLSESLATSPAHPRLVRLGLRCLAHLAFYHLTAIATNQSTSTSLKHDDTTREEHGQPAHYGDDIARFQEVLVRLLLVSPALPSASILRRVSDLLFLVIAANSPVFVTLSTRVAEELSFLPHNHERRPQVKVEIIGHFAVLLDQFASLAGRLATLANGTSAQRGAGIYTTMPPSMARSTRDPGAVRISIVPSSMLYIDAHTQTIFFRHTRRFMSSTRMLTQCM
jgi:hypothetical protein